MRRTYAQQQKEAPSLTGFIAADRHAFYTDCVLTSDLVLYKSTVVLRKSLLLGHNPCKYCHRCYRHLHRRVQCIGYANMRKAPWNWPFVLTLTALFHLSVVSYGQAFCLGKKSGSG